MNHCSENVEFKIDPNIFHSLAQRGVKNLLFKNAKLCDTCFYKMPHHKLLRIY